MSWRRDYETNYLQRLRQLLLTTGGVITKLFRSLFGREWALRERFQWRLSRVTTNEQRSSATTVGTIRVSLIPNSEAMIPAQFHPTLIILNASSSVRVQNVFENIIQRQARYRFLSFSDL